MPRFSFALALAFAVVVLLAASPGMAVGQTPTPVAINPNTIAWTASADHDTVLSDGTAILTKYEVRVYMKGAAQPFQVYDAGKPAPGVDRLISITNPAWFVLETINREGFAKVAAVGVAGVGLSDPSNPFAHVGPPAATPAPVVSRK